MTIVQTNPNSKILEIDNSLFKNGKEYVIPTKEDIGV
jgi:hypothetical protein